MRCSKKREKLNQVLQHCSGLVNVLKVSLQQFFKLVIKTVMVAVRYSVCDV